MTRCEFGTYHPVSVFAYMACVIVLTMFVQQPLLLLEGLVLASIFYVSVRGYGSWRVILAALLAMVALALFNAVFNTRGDTVLFTYLNSRHFTFEGLVCGFSTGAMLACVVILFGCFNRLLTSEKLLYLFGWFMPALTLTLTMIFRLVPSYQQQALQIHEARACIGVGAQKNAIVRGVNNAISVLSALATWAFENALITAASMKSRGYGLAKRTTYARYEFRPRDLVFLVLASVFTIFVLLSLINGSLTVKFYPSISFAPFAAHAVVGTVAYGALLIMPVVVNVKGSAGWLISKSRI